MWNKIREICSGSETLDTSTVICLQCAQDLGVGLLLKSQLDSFGSCLDAIWLKCDLWLYLTWNNKKVGDHLE
uniref:Uncharacterized protein n=1 Tax=Utricularia reniformis TaxID=192314 RepID=A0A1Y0B4D5_9LAMI|nr:hypothetical protein AEK19_MT2100 [Utricularia reniformis]ART32254.1 hypothetical protein AEK19_MT2100 [Utricularia reniformis]